MRYRIRSGVLATVMPVFLSVFAGCTGMPGAEWDERWEAICSTEEKAQADLLALQELAGAVNRDLTTLDLIVKELDDGHTIRPESFQETEDGYEVSFRDGKKIFIPYGKDGRMLIPVGVKDEDGVYYWQVDGKWLTDNGEEDGNKLRAGATDGIVPQFKVEEGKWWISVDGGLTFSEFADCEEMDGMGVFKDVQQTASGKVILTLWDGETVELMSQFPFQMSFEGPVRDTVLIAAGETLPIPYKIKVDGEPGQPLIVTSGTDGVYLSGIEAVDDTTGVVKVQAPAEYVDGYIFLSASCGGYSALKIIAFRPREITPAEPVVTVRLGSGSEPKALPYEANFDYVVKSGDAWLEVVSDPETGALTFTPQANAGETVRECEVTVSPKDNPEYVCTTFRIIQATEYYTVQLEENDAFAFDSQNKTLYAPAEGGDASLWLTFPATLSASVPETLDWIHAEMADEDGFRHLKVHVDPETSGAGRDGIILIRLQAGAVPIGEIKVIQAGSAAGE